MNDAMDWIGLVVKVWLSGLERPNDSLWHLNLCGISRFECGTLSQVAVLSDLAK